MTGWDQNGCYGDWLQGGWLEWGQLAQGREHSDGLLGSGATELVHTKIPGFPGKNLSFPYLTFLCINQTNDYVTVQKCSKIFSCT
jgi:hypothetical protein